MASGLRPHGVVHRGPGLKPLAQLIYRCRATPMESNAGGGGGNSRTHPRLDGGVAERRWMATFERCRDGHLERQFLQSRRRYRLPARRRPQYSTRSRTVCSRTW